METFTIHRLSVLRHEEQARSLAQIHVTESLKRISHVAARLGQALAAINEDYSEDFADRQKPNDCENDARVSNALLFWN